MEVTVGQIVRSLRGKDAGTWYIVMGFGEKRILVSDGKRFPPEHLKAKNAIHLQPTGWKDEEIAAAVARGETIDSGRIRSVICRRTGCVDSTNCREGDATAWRTKTR